MRQHPVSQGSDAPYVDLSSKRVSHRARDPHQADNSSDPPHVQEGCHSAPETKPLDSIPGRESKDQRQDEARGVNQLASRIRPVDIAADGATAIDHHEPAYAADLVEVGGRVNASKRAGRAVLLAAISRELAARRI